MNRIKRNLVIGIFIGFGVLSISEANAFEWTDAPQVVGTIVGSGIGSTIGSISSNPFVAGMAGAAGGFAGGKIGPYIADNPKTSVEAYSVALSGPIGALTYGVRAGTGAVLNFVANLFW